MERTQPVDWLGKACTGYVMNAEFSETNQLLLDGLANKIQAAFPGATFTTPKDRLHITLLDWIAPLVDYEGQDKAALFAQIQTTYDKAITEILAAVPSITIQFTELRVTPTAVIIIGRDHGEFQRIREQFLQKVELLPGTKRPPQLIHSSIIRFTKAIDLEPVQKFVAGKSIDFAQRLDAFRLLKTKREPMLDFEVLKQYRLGKA